MPSEYYYVTQDIDLDGFHILHKVACVKKPLRRSLIFIGSLYNPLQALTVGKVRFGENVKACYFCCLSHQVKGRRVLRPPLASPQQTPLNSITK